MNIRSIVITGSLITLNICFALALFTAISIKNRVEAPKQPETIQYHGKAPENGAFFLPLSRDFGTLTL